MQALRKTRPEAGLELVEVPLPTLEADSDDVLVKVRATGICGSDLHVDDWTPSYAFIAPSLPVTIGHEFVGVVASGAWAGQRVVVRPSTTCGACAACHAGQHDACERRRGIGMTRDGAFAPWVRVPARNCVPVPDSVSDELAALCEPLTISLQALRIAGEVAGQRALVIGPGTIGQGIAALARRAGARQVVVSGFDDAARFDVLRRMGFDALVDVAAQPLAEGCRSHTQGEPFDLVFEASGVPETITEGLALLRRNGIVVVAGIHARPLQLDLTSLVRNQQQLRGSFRPPESDWPLALALMGEMNDILRPMVSHVLPLSQATEGFALAHAKAASKVLLRPDPAANEREGEAHAVLALWNDVTPEMDADYNAWHAQEHVPERLTVPGMLWGLRYQRAQEGAGPRYLTLYGMRDAQVVESEAYRKLLSQPTPLSARMRPHLCNLSRWVCDVRLASGFEAPYELAVWTFETEADARSRAAACLAECRDVLLLQRSHAAAALPWLQRTQAHAIEGEWLLAAGVPPEAVAPLSSADAARYTLCDRPQPIKSSSSR